GGAAARTGRGAVVALAELDDDVRRLKPEDFGGHDGVDGALGGAEVLRRGLGGDAAVLADGDIDLVQPRGEPAPGMHRHADAVLDRAGLALARRVPLLLPSVELLGDA